jgi:hypothetical protein
MKYNSHVVWNDMLPETGDGNVIPSVRNRQKAVAVEES